MRTAIRILGVLLAAISLAAGIVISLSPIGACNHSPLQFASAFILAPAVTPFLLFFDAGSWTFQRHIFLIGALQGLLVVTPCFFFTRRRA